MSQHFNKSSFDMTTGGQTSMHDGNANYMLPFRTLSNEPNNRQADDSFVESEPDFNVYVGIDQGHIEVTEPEVTSGDGRNPLSNRAMQHMLEPDSSQILPKEEDLAHKSKLKQLQKAANFQKHHLSVSESQETAEFK